MRRFLMGAAGLGMLAAILVLCLAAAPAPGGIRRLSSPGRGTELPFSDVVVAGESVWLSGGIGIDPSTGMAPEEIDREVRLLMDGMKAKLELAGLTMDDLLSVQVFCSDLSLYGQFNDIYRAYFTKGFPARAFIGSGPILRGGHFEIQGVARLR